MRMEMSVHGPKPYELIWEMAIHDPKPYELISKIAIHRPKPYEFTGGVYWMRRPQCQSSCRMASVQQSSCLAWPQDSRRHRVSRTEKCAWAIHADFKMRYLGSWGPLENSWVTRPPSYKITRELDQLLLNRLICKGLQL